MTTPDATHDPQLRSWVESANRDSTDFPLQNLPYGRYRTKGSDEAWRVGVAIGEQILDLRMAREVCPWGDGITELMRPLAEGDLRGFMSRGRRAWHELRAALSEALTEGSMQSAFLESCLLPQAQAELTLPCPVGEYTDFYTGIHHARAVGKLFRPDNPLLPNYQWVPIGYHGRSSSIVPSGTPIRRPLGQVKTSNATEPTLQASRRLDFELELAAIVAQGNPQGSRIPIDKAENHLFGMLLLNDWSARDVQPWEYQPLGPFLSKNFGSTLSPWLVTMDALVPFRRPFVRPAGDPQPLPYLDSEFNRESGAISIELEVWLQTSSMRAKGQPPQRLMHSNYAEAAYWTLAQLVAHHTVGGCNLGVGDVLGTGTLSGPESGQGGSMLELSLAGQQPVLLTNGEQRSFLEDGDWVELRAFCAAPGARRIGFGSCAGLVLPAL